MINRRWWGRIVGASALAALLAGIAVLSRPYPSGRLAPAQATSLRVVARGGELLRELPLEGGGRNEWVALSRVASAAILATLASEDEHFFEHHGVDWRALLRAALLDLRARRFAYGGSTLTMQLSRLLQPRPRSLWAKACEIVAALRLERTIDKRQILTQYFNRAYYGNGAWGIATASQQYFGKPADSLSLAEATLLAVLPRGPRTYDPYLHLPQALERRAHILALLERRGLITPDEHRRALLEPLQLRRARPVDRAPHFVDWVLQTLPSPERERGGVIRTSLDWPLQELLEQRLREHVSDHQNLHDAGVVVVAPTTGEVLAMIGSADYHSPEGGRINITTTLRSPGSALKPFIYALALEAGHTPASLAADVHYPEERSVHHRLHEHGYARYREALSGSYNLAAVHLLETLGTEPFIERLSDSLWRHGDDRCRHLSAARLALGGCSVRLVDLAAAYGFLVSGGVVHPACGHAPCAPPRSLFTPEVSYLVLDMLSDPEARRSVFGSDLPLDLPFRVAAKTGTAAGFADTVAVAATREAIVAAWAGDFSGGGTRGELAMWSAAPLLRAGLLAVANGRPLTLPDAPATIVSRTVCRISGRLPGAECPGKVEHFIQGQEPEERCAGHPK